MKKIFMILLFISIFAFIRDGFCNVAQMFLKNTPTNEIQAVDAPPQVPTFSDRFKSSLTKCLPDAERIEFMGMKLLEIKIIGKETNGCHISAQGFHALLDDNDISGLTIDKLEQILSDKDRVSYNPYEKSDNVLYALKRCNVQKEIGNTVCGLGNTTTSFGKISIANGVDTSFENGACQIIFKSILKQDEIVSNHSIRCDVPERKITEYLGKYPALSQHYKFSATNCHYGNETDAVVQANNELLLQIQKDGYCKNLGDFPPVNSEGCSDMEPLKGRDGTCYSCDTAEKISVSYSKPEECERVCNGLHGRSSRIEKMGDCILAFCPKDTPLRDTWGKNCYSCDYEGPTDGNNCSLCPNRKLNQKGLCVINDNDYTKRSLIDINGFHYSCNTEEIISTEEGKCSSVCPNRFECGSMKINEISNVFCCLKN